MGTMALIVDTLNALPGWLTFAALAATMGIVGIVAGGGGAGDGSGAGGDGGDQGDGDAGDGDRGDGAAGDGDAGDGGDRRAAVDRGDAGDGDDDITDEEREREELLAALPPEEQAKRARTWNRKNQRTVRTLTPIAEQFRDPRSGRYLTPQEVARIRSKAADQEELEEFFNEHPDLLNEVIKRKKGGGRTAEAAAAEAFADPYANENDIPFDTASPEGKFLVGFMREAKRENHDLRQSVKRLEQALTGVNERDTQRTFTQIEATWKDETMRAATTAGLQGDDLQDFVNGVYSQFRLGKAERRLDKLDRKAIIERALRPFKRNRSAGDRRSAADAQRRAEGNTRVPRPGQRGAAQPANPNDTNRTGTIRDGRKSFFARQGLSAPPGGR